MSATATNQAMRLESCRSALSDVMTEHRLLREAIENAVVRAEAIEPEGSPEWVESGVAMRTTVLREIRLALDAN